MLLVFFSIQSVLLIDQTPSHTPQCSNNLIVMSEVLCITLVCSNQV